MVHKYGLTAPMTSTAHEHMYTFECIDYNSQTISDLVQSGMKRHCTGSSCMACGKQMEKYLGFVKAPIIISVLVDPGHRVSVDKYVRIKSQNGKNTVLNLCGLIYYKNFHFTCRVVDLDGKIWYNDGKSMGRSSTIDGTLQSITEDSIWS